MPVTTSCKVDWVDPNLTLQTKARKVHIEDLRLSTNYLRQDRNLPTVSFTDPSLDTTTKIRMIHIEELRHILDVTPIYTRCTDYYSDVKNTVEATDKSNHFIGHDNDLHTAHLHNHNVTHRDGYILCSTHNHTVKGSKWGAHNSDRHHTHLFRHCSTKYCVKMSNFQSGQCNIDRNSHDYRDQAKYYSSQEKTANAKYFLEVTRFCTAEYPHPNCTHHTSPSGTCNSYTLPPGVCDLWINDPSFHSLREHSKATSQFTNVNLQLGGANAQTCSTRYGAVNTTHHNLLNQCPYFYTRAKTSIFKYVYWANCSWLDGSDRTYQYLNVHNAVNTATTCYQEASPGGGCTP